MQDLLKDIYNKAESYQGRRLVNLLLAIFLIFLVIGFGVGFLVGEVNEIQNVAKVSNDDSVIREETSYEGKISYVDPLFYPEDNISYVLTDANGEELILLTASDEKLLVAEGHFAKVYGKLSTTSDKKSKVLIVDKVVIQNATN